MTITEEANPIPPEIESLSRMASKLFDLWKVPHADRARLLGVKTGDVALAVPQAGSPLVLTGETRLCLGHLMAIHKELRILFPHDRELAYSWVNSPNKAFGGRKPIEVMVEQGGTGLQSVRIYLAHANNP